MKDEDDSIFLESRSMDGFSCPFCGYKIQKGMCHIMSQPIEKEGDLYITPCAKCGENIFVSVEVETYFSVFM